MKIKTAVILAAGQGKRMDRFKTIKPLVKIAGKPLIVWGIEKLAEAGITRIHIVVKKGDKKIEKVLFDYSISGVEFSYIEQKDNGRGMLDSFLSLREKIKEPFFVAPCDSIFEKNPYKMFSDKMEDFTMLVSLNEKQNKISGAQSKAMLGQNSRVLSVGRELRKFNGLDTGICRFSSVGFRLFLKAASNVKEIEAAWNKLAKNNKIRAFVLDEGAWFDVNDPITLIRGELFLKGLLSKNKNYFAGKKTSKRIKGFINFYNKKNIRTEIIIKSGLIKNLEKYEIIPQEFISSPHYLITDENVNKIYGQKVINAIKKQGFNIRKIVVESGERAKDINNYIKLADEVLGTGIEEKSIIISLGGGVINNLAGFLAATLYRGVGLIHVPTTLMAQSDAAIGIKQGVNGEKGKNLIGSYYEPLKIFVDPEVLLSMDEYYIKDGLGECLKHALAQNYKYYKFFRNYRGSIRNLNFLEKVISANIKLKIKLMQKDFKEEKEAIVLQYGHEVGHAVEFLSGFEFGHGEAVAIGMRVSAEIANELGLANNSIVKEHIDLLKQYKLPYKIPRYIKGEDIYDALRYNKKMRDGDIRFALVNKIGSLWHYKSNYAIPCREEIIKKAIKRSYE
ncbi:MAG: hypothetical protein UT31_C0018G0006 [Parcubacteria group bacterium GW2011_GWF2_39_13b]|nr:MAG: hypothetical protein UT31_C0018G0006 [Parcubacteria group bacterium GW2011_GWF2_39_13b]